MGCNASQQYERDGFVRLEKGGDAPVVAHIRRAILRTIKEKEPTKRVLFTHEAPPETRPMTELMWQHRNILRTEDRRLQEILRGMRSRAAEVVGYDPIPLQDVSLVKRSGARPFPWHQDLPFWPVDRDDGCVVWLALDNCDQRNGAVEFAPASHRKVLGPAIDLHTGIAQDGTAVSAVLPEDGEIVELRSGDMLVFHARTFHRSGTNHTNEERWGFAVSFVHPETRWCHERAPRHPLCSTTVHNERVSKWSLKMYHPGDE